jgi:hypothetical protein
MAYGSGATPALHPAGMADIGADEKALISAVVSTNLFAECVERHSLKRGKRRPNSLSTIERRWFVGKQTLLAAARKHASVVESGALARFGEEDELVGTAILLQLAQENHPLVTTSTSTEPGYTVVALSVRGSRRGRPGPVPTVKVRPARDRLYYIHDIIVQACLAFSDNFATRAVVPAPRRKHAPPEGGRCPKGRCPVLKSPNRGTADDDVVALALPMSLPYGSDLLLQDTFARSVPGGDGSDSSDDSAYMEPLPPFYSDVDCLPSRDTYSPPPDSQYDVSQLYSRESAAEAWLGIPDATPAGPPEGAWGKAQWEDQDFHELFLNSVRASTLWVPRSAIYRPRYSRPYRECLRQSMTIEEAENEWDIAGDSLLSPLDPGDPPPRSPKRPRRCGSSSSMLSVGILATVCMAGLIFYQGTAPRAVSTAYGTRARSPASDRAGLSFGPASSPSSARWICSSKSSVDIAAFRKQTAYVQALCELDPKGVYSCGFECPGSPRATGVGRTCRCDGCYLGEY